MEGSLPHQPGLCSDHPPRDLHLKTIMVIIGLTIIGGRAYFWQHRSWLFHSVWIVETVRFEVVQLSEICRGEMSLNLVLVNDSLRQRQLCHLSLVYLLLHCTLIRKKTRIYLLYCILTRTRIYLLYCTLKSDTDTCIIIIIIVLTSVFPCSHGLDV